MRYKFWMCFLLLAAAIPLEAGAQGVGGPGFNMGHVAYGGGGGGYTGPGDTATYVAWGGTYAYNAATRGTKAVRLCKPSDSTCDDVNSDATTGIVPNPTIGGTPCGTGGDLCTVRCVYDQASGANTYDWCQSTEAQRVTWVVNCSGLTGMNCFRSSTSTRAYTSAANWTQAQPITMTTVSKRNTGVAATVVEMQIYDGNGSYLVYQGGGFFNDPDDMSCNDNQVLHPAATAGAWSVKQCVFNGASSYAAVNSTNTGPSTLGTDGSAARTINVFDGLSFLVGNPWQGDNVSFGVAASAFSTTVLGNINAANHTIAGF